MDPSDLTVQTDTAPEAVRVQLEILRRMTPEQRLGIGLELTEMSRRLLQEGIRTRHPDYGPMELRLAFLRAWLGAELFREAYPDAAELEPVIQEQAVVEVLGALDRLGVRYMLAGSFASNLHGVPRMTQDADIVVEVDEASALALARELMARFYVSESAVHEAVVHERMFNAIHLDSGFKIDLVVKKRRPFSDEELRRRVQATIGGRPAYFASAEDTVLTKLEWATLADSERQYGDAAAILRLHGAALDQRYLDVWAPTLGVESLLERARRDLPFKG